MDVNFFSDKPVDGGVVELFVVGGSRPYLWIGREPLCLGWIDNTQKLERLGRALLKAAAARKKRGKGKKK